MGGAWSGIRPRTIQRRVFKGEQQLQHQLQPLQYQQQHQQQHHQHHHHKQQQQHHAINTMHHSPPSPSPPPPPPPTTDATGAKTKTGPSSVRHPIWPGRTRPYLMFPWSLAPLAESLPPEDGVPGGNGRRLRQRYAGLPSEQCSNLIRGRTSQHVEHVFPPRGFRRDKPGVRAKRVQTSQSGVFGRESSGVTIPRRFICRLAQQAALEPYPGASKQTHQGYFCKQS